MTPTNPVARASEPVSEWPRPPFRHGSDLRTTRRMARQLRWTLRGNIEPDHRTWADLGAALWAARGSAPAVLPQTPDGRLHPTHALLARRLQPELQALLASTGGRSAARWLMAQGAVALPWPDALPNCNTPDSLQA